MKKIIISISATVLVAVAFVSIPQVRANVPFWNRCQLQSATTTRAYLTPGTATTTVSFPSSLCASNLEHGMDSAILLFQYTASSTAPTLNVRIEHSQNNVDWYPESIALQSLATSTQMSGDSLVYKFIMATSTDNGGSGISSRVHRSLTITTPTRYTRAIFSVPASGGNGALWAEVIAKKQNL